MAEYNYTVIIEREGGRLPCLLPCASRLSLAWRLSVQNITEALQLHIESLKTRAEPTPSEDVLIKPDDLAGKAKFPAGLTISDSKIDKKILINI